MLVVITHTCLFSYPLSNPFSLSVYACLHISIFIKIAVPLFFMVTGALLLNKEESIEVVLKKRVFRFFVVLVAFAVIQKIYSALCILKYPFDLKSFFEACLSAQYRTSVGWFLFAYLAIMLLLPFLRTLARNMTNQHFYYLLSLQLIFTAFSPFSGGVQKWLILSNYYEGHNIFIFLFVGYFLEHRLDKDWLTNRNLVCLVILSFLSILLGAAMCEIGRCYGHQSYYTCEVPCFQGCLLIPGITIYLLLKRTLQHFVFSERAVKTIATLQGSVFSLMLIENILRKFAYGLTSPFSESPLVATILSLPIVYLLGFSFGWLMKRIPIVKDYV